MGASLITNIPYDVRSIQNLRQEDANEILVPIVYAFHHALYIHAQLPSWAKCLYFDMDHLQPAANVVVRLHICCLYNNYCAFLRGFANNKGADQPVHPHSIINAFVIHLMKRIIS